MDEEAVRETRGGTTRRALLDAAAGLLEEGGMGAVTLRAVGERVGVTKQALHNHFADKATLLSVLAARYLWRLDERMAEAAQRAEVPVEGLEAMVGAYVRFALGSPSRYRLIGQEMSGSAHEEVHEAARSVHARFVGGVAACQEAGELPGGDPVELAAILFATTHGAVELTLSGHAREEKGLGDPVELVEALLVRLRRD